MAEVIVGIQRTKAGKYEVVDRLRLVRNATLRRSRMESAIISLAQGKKRRSGAEKIVRKLQRKPELGLRLPAPLVAIAAATTSRP